MKYVIEYMGGCKGDLLTRFLLGEEIVMDSHNKTAAKMGYYNLKKFMHHTYMTNEDVEITLRDLSASISPAHALMFLNNSYHVTLLEKYEITIKKILFHPRFYRTIHVENVFKGIYYHGFDLLSGPGSPAEKFDELLRCGLSFYDDFNHLDSCLGRHLWSYDNLYIHFNQRDELFNDNFNWNEFKKYVERSWLPESIEFLGETWKPRDYGYRDW